MQLQSDLSGGNPGNPGTLKHKWLRTQAHFRIQVGTHVISRTQLSARTLNFRIQVGILVQSTKPAERKHTQNSSTNLGKIKHIECNYIQNSSGNLGTIKHRWFRTQAHLRLKWELKYNQTNLNAFKRESGYSQSQLKPEAECKHIFRLKWESWYCKVKPSWTHAHSDTSGNHGMIGIVKSNTAKRKHGQIQAGIVVRWDTAERKHIQIQVGIQVP